MIIHGARAFLLFLVACSIKATVPLGAAWFLSAVARNSSAAWRHRFWSVAVVTALAMPLLVVSMPGWQSAAIDTAAQRLWRPFDAGSTTEDSRDVPAMILSTVVAAPARHQWSLALILIWLLGLSLLALRMVVGLSRLATLSARAKPLPATNWLRMVSEVNHAMGVSGPVRLLAGADLATMPLTWGVLRPVILLPSGALHWPEGRRRMVLTHELAHVARRDWLFQICSELLRALYWFQPLAWLAAKRLRQESELASDDAVLQAGIAAPEYADQLLHLARSLTNARRAWSSALALARRSHLERRFAAMLNPSLNRDAPSRRTRAFTLLCAVLVLLPLAALRLPAQNAAAKFSGAILDPSGAVVPNATVIMTDCKTKKTTMTTTDAQGKFSFTSLPAGDYDLRATKRGFEDFRVRQVLNTGQARALDITLGVAAVTYQDEVVAKGTVKGLPPAEPGGKTTRVRIGGDIQAPKLIDKVQPVYPENARAAGSEGTVILHAVIGTDGTPLSLRVVNDKIDPELARAAIESVSQWRYSPTLLNGQPIEVDTTIEVNFTLQP